MRIGMLLFAMSFAACASQVVGVKRSSSPELLPRLFFNGPILTMEGDTPSSVESLVTFSDKIVFVGTEAEARALFPNAEALDLDGQTLLPGFIDPHSHIGMVADTMGQADLSSPPVGNTRSVDDIVASLVALKKDLDVQPGQWIFGWGYDESQLDERRHPTRDELDAAFPDNPVYVQHTSGHMGVANSMALERAGIKDGSPDPEGGMIVRVPGTDRPTGLVQETAMYFFAGTAIAESQQHKARLFERAQDLYVSFGVTTACDGMTDPANAKFFQERAAKGGLKLDLLAFPGNIYLDQPTGWVAGDDTATLTFGKTRNGLKFQGIKIVADGSPQGKTAFFTQPYLTPVEGCDSDCRGFPNLTQDELNRLFVIGYRDGLQLYIHSNGDASIDMVIRAHEFASRELKQPLDADRRTVVIHSQFVRPDQLETYKRYRMVPALFTNHAFFWGDQHVENLGEERAFFLSPIPAAAKLGLPYTNHSDATVTPINPMFTVWTAVNRLSRSGKVMGPDERATVYQALKAVTANVAFQFFEEAQKGTLAVGKQADLVVLDRNPMAVGPLALREIRVMQTIKGGRTIYERNDAQETSR